MRSTSAAAKEGNPHTIAVSKAEGVFFWWMARPSRFTYIILGCLTGCAASSALLSTNITFFARGSARTPCYISIDQRYAVICDMRAHIPIWDARTHTFADRRRY